MNRLSSFQWRSRAVIIAIFAVFLTVLAIFAVASMVAMRAASSNVEVKLNNSVYHLALADSGEELTKGLSGTESLDPDGGLLMDFGVDSRWGIWMKDMKIPLDIVWLDREKRVVYIKENVSHELGTSVTMRPDEPNRYVIELPAGSVSKSGIAVGQLAEFTIQGGK